MNGTPKLIILTEKVQAEKMFELSAALYTIGRGEDQSVCLPDSTVSSAHCQLTRNDDGNYSVLDLGSSNGTRINGIRITEQKLEHSDILQVGGIEILYHSDNHSRNFTPSTRQTGINLENTENGVPINEMENVNPFKRDKKNIDKKKVNLIFTLAFSLLILAVLVLAGYFIRNVLQ